MAFMSLLLNVVSSRTSKFESRMSGRGQPPDRRGEERLLLRLDMSCTPFTFKRDWFVIKFIFFHARNLAVFSSVVMSMLKTQFSNFSFWIDRRYHS